MNDPAKKDAFNNLPPGTILESDEDMLRAQDEIRKSRSGPLASKRSARESAGREFRFSPLHRPPIALLTVCDDGEPTGEIIRIRTDRFLIGRTEGDLQLPHDELISTRHVMLARQVVSGQVRWAVTDLQSRNGVFFRVKKAPLKHDAEVLIGRGKYRFEIARQAVPDTGSFAAPDLGRPSPNTRAWSGDLPPGTETLAEILASGAGARCILTKDEYWIGRDSNCDICRADDPCVSGKHASLTRSPRGTWVIQHHRTVNGVWLRMPHIAIGVGELCEFQIGEQRFRLHFGSVT